MGKRYAPALALALAETVALQVGTLLVLDASTADARESLRAGYLKCGSLPK